jgi:hypothetical protein
MQWAARNPHIVEEGAVNLPELSVVHLQRTDRTSFFNAAVVGTA